VKAAALRSRIRSKRRVALVCAGGGVTGAVYQIGYLRALEELLDRSVLDFDLFVGVSGGAFVTSLLANGVSPEELYDAVASRVVRPLGASAAPLFRLGLTELARRSTRAPRVLGKALWTALTSEGRNVSDLALALFEVLPAGLLDTSGLQEFLADLFARPGRTDSFARLKRELYIVAVDLDGGDAVAFGEKGAPRVPISKAVQASIALPGLYRPVRIDGRDYVDGGVKKTAHINLAIQNGADLVICINPLVPIRNPAESGPLRGHLSNRGLTFVLDQVLRIVMHGRMEYGLERYRAEHPEVDILLIEPPGDDLRMFTYNIMRYSARRVVAEHGYRSVLRFFRENEASYRGLLKRAGIGLKDPHLAPETPDAHPYRSPMARSLAVSLDRLDSRLR
jgi:NTE family protein